MKASDIDWSVLRGAILVLVVAIALAAGLAGSAYYYGERQDRVWAKAKRELDAVRARYRAVDEEAQLIDRYLPEYRRLESAGVIGAEHRLDWIETLRASAARVRVPSLRYEIASQQPFVPDFDLDLGRFHARESRMSLEIGLLHEVDLLRLFDDMGRHSRGLYQLQECRVARNGTEFLFEPDRSNLTAACRVRWLTLARPEARE